MQRHHIVETAKNTPINLSVDILCKLVCRMSYFWFQLKMLYLS